MPAPYSQDLRIRVASALSGGSSTRNAADRFGIGISTAIRWAQRLQTEGHVGELPRDWGCRLHPAL
jgi:transposase